MRDALVFITVALVALLVFLALTLVAWSAGSPWLSYPLGVAAGPAALLAAWRALVYADGGSFLAVGLHRR